MMKRFGFKIALFALLSVFLVSAISFSLSWFDYVATLTSIDLGGETQGSYFKSGTGTEDDPYILDNPVHVYNLAWLQYIGHFNEGQDDDGTGSVSSDDQTYFRLDDDIDMEGFNSAIPPIGTQKYPFIGHFDGNGHTISNCQTSNDFSETTKRPSIITELNDVDVVGFFGVVGKIDGQQTFTYSTAINRIENLGLLGCEVRSCTSPTLVGIAAGYVNGTLDNVAVNGCSLYTQRSATPMVDIATGINVSDYSLVGYATSDFRSKVKLRTDDANIPTLVNPNTDQGGDNWGGSINMLDMYNYLRGLADSSTPFQFATNQNVYFDSEGNKNIISQSGLTNNALYSSDWGEQIRYEGNSVVEDGKEYASFTFARSSTNNFSSYDSADDQYICLYGAEEKRGTTVTSSYGGYSTNKATGTITTNTYAGTDFFIHNGAGTSGTNGNYLVGNTNGNAPTNQNSATSNVDRIKWNWSGKYIKNKGRNTYLSISNGSLTCTTSATTEWTYDESKRNLYATSNGVTYCLQYNSGWSLVGDTVYYVIHSGSKYMAHNSSDTSSSYYMNEATSYDASNLSLRWYKSGNYFYGTTSNTFRLSGYNNQYVCYGTAGNGLTYSAASGSLNDATSTGYLTYNSRYAYYNSGQSHPWQMRTTSTALTFDRYVESAASATRDIHLGTHNYSTTPYYQTSPTYFPLTREKGEDGKYTGSGKPDAKNTGYIVSGCNLTAAKQGLFGDIRVSYFPMSSISVAMSGSSSYDSSKLEVVTHTCVRGDNGHYTDKYGWTLIEDTNNASNTPSSSLTDEFGTTKRNFKTDLRLSKYNNSRAQLGNTLSEGGGKIYGLHFMDAAISKNNFVTAPNVTILDGKTLDAEGKATGTKYTQYPLPQDSIDFHLKDQGYINFFAGSYFNNGTEGANDTFFSLNVITRNSDNSIAEIKQIKKIYAPTGNAQPDAEHPYIYAYDNNVPDGAGDMAFDCDWITNPTMVMNAVYYFEIPVNAGEYALGSVSGKNGAYLMYLDIGAGIGNYKDIVTTEEISITVEATDYPLGVDFSTHSAGSSWVAIAGGKTASVTIATGTNAGQTLTYNYESTDLGKQLIVETSGNDPPLSSKYEASDVRVKKKIGETTTGITLVWPSLYNMAVERVTHESFNPFTSSVAREVTETTEITGGESGLTIQLAKPVASSGFSIDSITYSVQNGDPATVDANGLVTRTGTGKVTVSMSYTESKSNVETWDSASSATSDDTEGRIFKYHFRDFDNPNIKVRYVYDGPNRTYTLYITAAAATILDIDALPLTGYTVIINDGTTTTELTSASTSISSINIAASA